MHDPTTPVVTDAHSATRERLIHRATSGLNVSSTTVYVLAFHCSTDTTVVSPRSVSTNDSERSAAKCSDALEDLDEFRVWAN